MTSEGCVKNITFSANPIIASLHWLLVVTLAGFTLYWVLSVYWLIRSILFMSLSLSIQFTVHMCGHGTRGRRYIDTHFRSFVSAKVQMLINNLLNGEISIQHKLAKFQILDSDVYFEGVAIIECQLDLSCDLLIR